MGRYKLKLSQEVPGAGGFRNSIRIGYPVQQDMDNNICLVAEGSYEFIPLNANILRDALLSSPEFCNRVLGLVVKDRTEIVENLETRERKGAKKK